MKRFVIAFAMLMLMIPATAFANPANGVEKSKAREIMIHMESDIESFTINDVAFTKSGSKYKSDNKYDVAPVETGVDYDTYSNGEIIGTTRLEYHTGNSNHDQGEWQFDGTFTKPEVIDPYEEPEPEDDPILDIGEPIEGPVEDIIEGDEPEVVPVPEDTKPVEEAVVSEDDTEKIVPSASTELPKTGDILVRVSPIVFMLMFAGTILVLRELKYRKEQ